MTYVKVSNAIYPATVIGKTSDREWDNRESKAITIEGTYSEVDELFLDGTVWSILDDVSVPVHDEHGNITYETTQQEFDNSEFYIRGDLTVHVDGTCTVKMGKPTDLEDAYEILYGGM